MLKVHIIFNDCPNEFDDKEILRVFMTREGARKYVKEKKLADSYKYQYLEVVSFNVEIK